MEQYNYIWFDLCVATFLVIFAYFATAALRGRDVIDDKLRMQGWDTERTTWNGTIYRKGAFTTRDKWAATEWEKQLELNDLGMLDREG